MHGCSAVLGHFVFGAQTCGVVAVAKVQLSDIDAYVCLEHCDDARKAGHTLIALEK